MNSYITKSGSIYPRGYFRYDGVSFKYASRMGDIPDIVSETLRFARKRASRRALKRFAQMQNFSPRSVNPVTKSSK